MAHRAGDNTQVLALGDPDLAVRLAAYREKMSRDVEVRDAALQGRDPVF